jgi:cytochrome c oxidase subunit I+III
VTAQRTGSTDSAELLHQRLEMVWRTPPGLAALTGVNHSSVGLRFIVTGFIYFLLAGLVAMLIRSQLSFAGNDLLGPRAYNQAFTLHGTAMMFFFAVPVLEGIAMYFVPKMIGARDLVFPRLSAFGYWCYLFGGILLFSSVLFGQAPDGGWFMYVPLTTQPFSPGKGADFWLLGVTFAEISAVAGAVELVVSILKTRAPGMRLDRMPLFAWYVLVTAFMIVYAFPPLILAGILLELERAFGLPFYTPALGGDPLLWQHLFWLFGHPEVYIILLPAAAIVSTVVPTFARRPIEGYSWIVLAVIAMGFISFGLWVHHMFTTGIPWVSLGLFSAASLAVVIPTGIQVFAWIATLWNGRPVVGTPLLFVLGFFFIFVLGGLTGVMVAVVPFDWQVHDTHFVVAHLHYVLVGGMVFPVLAGLYYWLPLLSGRSSEPATGKLVFWLIFVGFNVTFLPMHLTGLLGMPRRVYTYAPYLGWETLNLVSTVGGFLMAAGVGMFLVDVWSHLHLGPRARANFWRAGTLEWALRAPAPSYNFASQPSIESRDPLWQDEQLPGRIARGEFLLGHADPRRRETVLTSAVGAQPQAVAILPGNTWVPLVAAAFVALFFAAVLTRLYALALLATGLAALAFLVWAWGNSDRSDEQDMPVGQGIRLPLHFAVPRAPGWWGTVMTIQADAALFASLLFAFFFLWSFAPNWPPVPAGAVPLLLPAIGLAALLASSVALRWGSRRVARGDLGSLRRAYLSAIALAALWLVLQFRVLTTSGIAAAAHAHDALVFTVSGFVGVHLGVAMLMAAFVVLRSVRGYVARHRPVEPEVAELFWHYVVLQAFAAFASVHALPALLRSI